MMDRALSEDDMDDAELEGIIERNRRELEREELASKSEEENEERLESVRKTREDAEKTSRHPLRAYRDAIRQLRCRVPVQYVYIRVYFFTILYSIFLTMCSICTH